jgi:hypothetical protein
VVDGSRVIVSRCPACRIWDDDDDLVEHVARCPACQADMLAIVARLDAEEAAEEYADVAMPELGMRESWARWANRIVDAAVQANWRLKIRVRPRPYELSAASKKEELLVWLEWADPNGDYQGLSLAALWEQLGFFLDQQDDEDD